tara:strand:+ start:33 stop:908 length:876 start_codon:yes stop_codon:yes gene_type:complete
MGNNLVKSVLGRTGIEVTRLGYGAMAIRDTSTQISETILNEVIDHGVNFIDTSNDYGNSEEMIGKFISHRRSEYFLATKCGCPSAGGDHIWTRENLFRGLHESLKRLNTDYIDLMQLHNATVDDVDQGGLIDLLEEMREQGKVKWIGSSSISPSIETFIKRGDFDEYQIPYSGLDRDHEQIISDASASGAGTVIRGGVQQGEPGPNSRGRLDKWEQFESAQLDDLMDNGESRTGFLLRYTMTHPDIDTIIVGTKNSEHLMDNIQMFQRGPLPKDIYIEAKARLITAIGPSS